MNRVAGDCVLRQRRALMPPFDAAQFNLSLSPILIARGARRHAPARPADASAHADVAAVYRR